MNKAEFDKLFYEELGGQGAKIAQNPVELWEVVQRLTSLQPKRILEIGVYYGGTARIWQELASESVVAIDLDTSQITVDFPGNSYPIFIHGDSTVSATIEKAEEYAPYDFLWIDGGHTYEIAKSDQVIR